MNWQKIAGIGILLAGLASIVAWWWHSLPEPVPTGTYAPAAESPKISGMATTPVKGVVNAVAPTKEAKVKLGLSTEIQNNPNMVVIGASTIPTNESPMTVVSTWNFSTGEVEDIVMEEPKPWLAAESRGYIRIGYGIKSRVGAVGQLGAGYNFLQIKSWHIGVDGLLFTDGQGYVGGHLDYLF